MSHGEPIHDDDLVWGWNSCRGVIHRALAAQRARTSSTQFKFVLQTLAEDIAKELAEPLTGINPEMVHHPTITRGGK